MNYPQTVGWFRQPKEPTHFAEPYVERKVPNEREPDAKSQPKRTVPSALWERAKRAYAGPTDGQPQLGLRFCVLLLFIGTFTALVILILTILLKNAYKQSGIITLKVSLPLSRLPLQEWLIYYLAQHYIKHFNKISGYCPARLFRGH
jgi:hypothetical protein